MDVKLISRDTFSICGYFAETCLETCEKDLSMLRHDFEIKKDELFCIYGDRKDHYGLMWYTEGHRYCYLYGIEIDDTDKIPAGACCKRIPGTLYSVARIPQTIPAVDAWTEYFDKALPEFGYSPNAEHGLNFEYYPEGSDGAYELWTPVIKREHD